MEPNSVLLLGVGNVGLAVAKYFASTKKIYGTTRDGSKADYLRSLGIEPIVVDPSLSEANLKTVSSLADGQYVVATFPPSSNYDEALSKSCQTAKAIVYVSATSVYGQRSGLIDASTTVDESDKNAKLRLKSENVWRAVNAVIVRAPGIYGPNSGLHLRLKDGTYSLPADGMRYVSRIHVDDLAAIIDAALHRGKPGNVYLIGDLQPTTHLEAVQWLCNKMNVPLPASVPLHAVSHTLRGNRQVVSEPALKELGVTLKYPTYKEGFSHCLQAMEKAVV